MNRLECVDFRIPPENILLEMIVVPSGSCRRFTNFDNAAASAKQPPPIQVPAPFLLGKYPVSLAQWAAVEKRDARWITE